MPGAIGKDWRSGVLVRFQQLWRRTRRLRPPPLGFAKWIQHKLSRLNYAMHIEPTWLEINRTQIIVPGWSPPRPLRIVHMTDFHLQQRVPAAYVAACVEAANAEQPDIIALTGDFIHSGEKFVEPIADLLAPLKAPLGVYAVLGNHDYAVRNALGVSTRRQLPKQVASALERRGIRVFHNELLTLTHGGLALQISGVEDLWSRACRPDLALARLDSSLPHIMLAHHPRTIELLTSERCDLMLSGHTHGGQVVFPRAGAITLSRRMKCYASGLYPIHGRLLYVNKGIGFGFKIRYNSRPEIAVFDLAGPVATE